MLIAGLDLAAEPKGTALAVIDWAIGSAALADLQLGVTDSQILAGLETYEKLGIDCALGWPIEFVNFMNRNLAVADGLADQAFDGGIEMRRRLAYRETDRHVRAVTGRWPLSVSTDRLAMTAIRCAGLLSQMQVAQVAVDRAGTGRVVEIYPGASLRLWGFSTAGYRASEQIRSGLVRELKVKAPWLDLAEFEGLMVESCDAFDSVIAALAARSAHLGFFEGPSQSQLEQARREGWVALPNSELNELIGQR